MAENNAPVLLAWGQRSKEGRHATSAHRRTRRLALKRIPIFPPGSRGNSLKRLPFASQVLGSREHDEVADRHVLGAGQHEEDGFRYVL